MQERQSMESHHKKYSKAPDEIWLSRQSVTKKTKKNKQKKTSHFFIYSRRATQDPHHTWHGDRGGPSHLIFFDPSSSFAARGY